MTFNTTCKLKAINLNTSYLLGNRFNLNWYHNTVYLICPARLAFTPIIAWNSSDRLRVLAMWTFFAFITWLLFPYLGVEAPFGSFSTSLSFRTMSWIARCSLRTYLNYPFNFFHPSHHTWTRSRREGFYLSSHRLQAWKLSLVLLSEYWCFT